MLARLVEFHSQKVHTLQRFTCKTLKRPFLSSSRFRKKRREGNSIQLLCCIAGQQHSCNFSNRLKSHIAGITMPLFAQTAHESGFLQLYSTVYTYKSRLCTFYATIFYKFLIKETRRFFLIHQVSCDYTSKLVTTRQKSASIEARNQSCPKQKEKKKKSSSSHPS